MTTRVASSPSSTSSASLPSSSPSSAHNHMAIVFGVSFPRPSTDDTLEDWLSKAEIIRCIIRRPNQLISSSALFLALFYCSLRGPLSTHRFPKTHVDHLSLRVPTPVADLPNKTSQKIYLSCSVYGL